MSNILNKLISPFKRLWLILLAVGPGIFCIGYTIGTGSVTAMSKSGSEFGTQLLWVLAFSCLFSWVLMEAYGRYAVVTGETAVHSFKTKFKFGRLIAIVVIIGITAGQWSALSGLVGLSSAAVYETLRIFLPQLDPAGYGATLTIAILIMAVMYTVLWFGTYSLFEKVLVFFVTLLAMSFVVSMFIVLPPATEIARGLIPSIPDVDGANLMIAAFVGTTMAAPTFVVRPLLVKSKGWTQSSGGFG